MMYLAWLQSFTLNGRNIIIGWRLLWRQENEWHRAKNEKKTKGVMKKMKERRNSRIGEEEASRNETKNNARGRKVVK